MLKKIGNRWPTIKNKTNSEISTSLPGCFPLRRKQSNWCDDIFRAYPGQPNESWGSHGLLTRRSLCVSWGQLGDGGTAWWHMSEGHSTPAPIPRRCLWHRCREVFGMHPNQKHVSGEETVHAQLRRVAQDLKTTCSVYLTDYNSSLGATKSSCLHP